VDAVNHDCLAGDATASPDLHANVTLQARSIFHYPERFDLTSLTYIKVILKQPFTSGVVFATMWSPSRLMDGHNRDEALST
jgi:hypothetical protein